MCPFVLFHNDRFFKVCCLFHQWFSAAYLFKLLRAHSTLFVRCDKPELTRWCLCSLHAGIQMSPDEVVVMMVVAIPSQKALLMCPYVSSCNFSVLAPRCSRAPTLLSSRQVRNTFGNTLSHGFSRPHQFPWCFIETPYLSVTLSIWSFRTPTSIFCTKELYNSGFFLLSLHLGPPWMCVALFYWPEGEKDWKQGLQSPWDLSAFTLSLSPPVHPSPIFLTDTEKLVGCSVIPARSCPGPVWYPWGSIEELEMPPGETPGLMTFHPHNTNILQSVTYDKSSYLLQSVTYDKSPYLPDRSNPGQEN